MTLQPQRRLFLMLFRHMEVIQVSFFQVFEIIVILILVIAPLPDIFFGHVTILTLQLMETYCRLIC